MAFGQSLHIDLYGVERSICDDLAFGYQTLDDLATFLGMHKQSPPFVFRSPDEQFPDKAGLSGWIPLIESGISIHTLVQHGFVTIDLYTCGDLNIDEATKFLTDRFHPEKFERHHLIRGTQYGNCCLPNSIKDTEMIPIRKVKREPWKLSTYQQGQHEFSRVTLFFEQISLEMGWQPGNQIRAYDANSTFLALETGGEIVGGIHIVRGNTDEGMPLLKVWPEFTPENIAEYADITLLAISRTHRGNLLAPWLLIAEAWRFGKKQNLLKVWGTIPIQNLALYNRIGWPWKKIGPAKPYWGDELCYPCMIDLDELESIVVRRAEKSALHKEVLTSMYR